MKAAILARINKLFEYSPAKEAALFLISGGITEEILNKNAKKMSDVRRIAIINAMRDIKNKEQVCSKE